MDIVIAGRFTERGWPILRARLIIPRIDVSGRVNFLVDTGASGTCLHPDDGARIRVPFDELGDPRDRVGVGGSVSYYHEPASILLHDGERDRTFDITLSIARPQPPTPPNPRPVVNLLPSLLGRDVLNRLRIDYDHPAGRLNFFP